MEIREPGEVPQVLEAIEPWKPSAAELAAFAGDYTSAEVATVFRFAVVNGTLVLRHRTIPPDPWTPSVARLLHGGLPHGDVHLGRRGRGGRDSASTRAASATIVFRRTKV